MYGQVADLTSNWQTFEYIFTASGFSGTTWDGRLRLWFSGKTGAFQLDDVSILPVGVAAASVGREARGGGQLYLPAVANETSSVQAAAIDATTTIITKYYYFGAQRVAMATDNPNLAAFRYLYWDHLGSTVVETNTSGNVMHDQGYYAFGAYRDTDAGDGKSDKVITDHKFTGQKLDGSGLMFYNARYYDPTIGQFVSPDTLVPDPLNPMAYNRYMYVLGNPLNLVNPSGYSSCATGDDWCWKNRWYEAHGFSWGGSHWNTPDTPQFADEDILHETIGEAGITFAGGWNWGSQQRQMTAIGQGIVQFGQKLDNGLSQLMNLLNGGAKLRQGSCLGSSCALPPGTHTVSFSKGTLSADSDWIAQTTVHELGHIID